MNWHELPLLRSVVLLTFLALAPDCESREDPRAGMETGVPNVAVDALFADWSLPGAPGCALAVSQDGALAYTRGYGYANLDYDIPVTPQTVFDVASVTKQFVAAGLTMLELEGKLSLDDDVRRWLPELPAYEWPVTLRHMVHHTSGLRDYLNLFPLAGRDDYYPISHAQILAMMSRQRALNFQPGARYEYSNTAYMLLAQVIERVSGQSLGGFTAGRIFGPLGMAGSLMYDNVEMIVPRRATGYGRDGAGRLRSVHNWNFDVAGDGQLYTTVEDLLRWDAYLHGAEAPAIQELMVTDGYLNNGEPIGYARGIELGEYRGLRTLEHSGSSWGFRSQLIRFPDTGLAIAIACNSDHARPVEMSRRVADHYLADQLGSARVEDEDSTHEQGAEAEIEPPALTTGQLREFSGAFISPELDATYRINVVEGALQLRIEQEPPLAVEPMGPDAFTFSFHPRGWSEPETVRLDFRRDENGAISGFLLSAGRERDIVFERRQPAGLVIKNARVIDGSGGPSRTVSGIRGQSPLLRVSPS